MMISSQPGRYAATGVTTKRLIDQAYGIKDFQISGGPSWVSSDRYDVDAKVEDSVVTELQKTSSQPERGATEGDAASRFLQMDSN